MYSLVFCATWGHLSWGKSAWTGRVGQLDMPRWSLHTWAHGDGCMGGGRSFVAPLNPVTMINPLSSPHINTKGCHVGRDGYLQGLGNGQRGGLQCWYTSPSHWCQGVWTSTFRFLGGWLGHSHSGSPCQHLLAVGGTIGKDKCDKASQRRPYKAFSIRSRHGQFYLWRPAASNQIASLQRKVACCNKCSPLKEKKGEIILKGYAILNIAMKQLKMEREVNTRKHGGNTWVSSPWILFSAGAGTPPTSSQVHAQSISIVPWWKP